MTPTLTIDTASPPGSWAKAIPSLPCRRAPLVPHPGPIGGAIALGLSVHRARRLGGAVHGNPNNQKGQQDHA